MAEPGITRLARRLAEENNVDWRSLEGSGEAGQVVEMDVLDYLARVMAGEEAVDPTPEPLPEGMTSWPEQDTFQPEEAGTGVKADGSGADDFGFDEDIFLFDDDDTAAGPSAGETTLQETEPPAETEEDTGWPAGDDSDWLLGEDDGPEESLFQAYPSADEPAGGADASEPAVPETPDGFGRWPGFGDDDAGAEDEKSVFREDDRLEAQKSVFGEDDKLDDFEFSDDDLLDLSFEDGELDDPWLLDEDLREFESGPLTESLEQQAGRAGAADGSVPEHPEDTAADADALLPVPEETRKPDTGLEAAAPAADDPPVEDEPRAALTGADLPVEDEPWAALTADDAPAEEEEPLSVPEMTGEGFPPAGTAPAADGQDDDEAMLLARRIEAAFESVADEPPAFEDFDEEFADDLATAEESTADGEPDFPAGAAGVSPAAALPAETPAPAPEAVPAARVYVLRRHVDLTALDGACVFAAEEFPGTPAPLLRGIFLQLAARRAAARSGFRHDAGPAALVTLYAAEPVSHELPETARFSALLEAVRTGSAESSRPPEDAAFVTADLSGLDVDEMLFPFSVPAVTLGSARTPAGTDGKIAVLSLSGAYDITAGAVFLQELAGLLLSPVRILL